ncbi:MAG: thioesterase [Clostridium perfringens]|nr:thioesterase [Clostridium perfringens]
MSENKFMKKYDVLYYDSDVNKNIRMVPLMKIFGDVSAIHEEELAYEGIKYLKDHELSWIIYSYSIDIKKPIPYKSSINVETYLEGIKKFYACRVYKVYNEKNELVAEGKIIFLLIDLDT